MNIFLSSNNLYNRPIYKEVLPPGTREQYLFNTNAKEPGH